MDSLTVTREQFRLDKKNELEFLAQALGNVSGSYTTQSISPTAVTLQGSPTLAATAEPAANDSSLRLANTSWVKKYANSASDTAPNNPINGQIWIDTSKEPPLLQIWDENGGPDGNGGWVEVSGSGGGANAYTLANDDANLVGGTATEAINKALIDGGSIASTDDLNVSDLLQVTDSGNADANPNVRVGRYLYDGTNWFTTKEITGFLELTGGNMTGAVTQTEREITVAAGGFDLSTSNFWRCNVADVPNPTSGINGQSGLIRLETVVTSWGGNFKNTPASTEVGDIIPFYVESASSIALGTKNITGTANTGSIYAGASAWGSVNADASVNGALNCTVSKTVKPDGTTVAESTGQYYVTFNNALPNGNYSVTAAAGEGTTRSVSSFDRTAQGFTIHIGRDTDGTRENRPFCFAVHSSNATPPRGGTGADAWGLFDGTSGATSPRLTAGFNVATVDRTGSGTYQVTFTNRMPNANYSAVASSAVNIAQTLNLTETGFTINTRDPLTNNATDVVQISFVVHATNAQLPDTVTQEQLDAVLDNWTRTGTTLSPTNAGDSIVVDGSATFASGASFYSSGANLQVIDNYINANYAGLACNNKGLCLGGSGDAVAFAGITTTTSTGTPLHVFLENGVQRIYGSTSLRAAKTNIQFLPTVWDKIKALNPCSFNGVQDHDRDVNSYGFIAEEANEVDTHFGVSDAGGLKSVNYNAITVALTAALKESITRIEQLEARVAELEGGN